MRVQVDQGRGRRIETDQVRGGETRGHHPFKEELGQPGIGVVKVQRFEFSHVRSSWRDIASAINAFARSSTFFRRAAGSLFSLFVRVVILTASVPVSCPLKLGLRNSMRSLTFARKMRGEHAAQNVRVDFAASNSLWIPCKTVFLCRS